MIAAVLMGGAHFKFMQSIYCRVDVGNNAKPQEIFKYVSNEDIALFLKAEQEDFRFIDSNPLYSGLDRTVNSCDPTWRMAAREELKRRTKEAFKNNI